MTDTTPAFSGEVMLLDWSETAKGGAKIVLQLDGPDALEPFRTMTLAKRGIAGQRLMAVLVEIGEDEKPIGAGGLAGSGSKIFEEARDEAINKHIIKPSVEEKPFGKEASQLYRNGFFYVPAVLEAIGTDAEFLDWIRAQPCTVTGKRDYHKDEATGIVTERCDPAHVRTVANGAGTGIKPKYCAIPLVHSLHDLETTFGKSALYVAAHDNKRHDEPPEETERLASGWMDKKRNEYVVKWASTTLAKHFGFPSMGFVQPMNLFVWAKAHKVEQYLPTAYRWPDEKYDLSQTWK